MSDIIEPALTRLIAILTEHEDAVPDLSDVIHRLEFLQQLLEAPVNPNPAYVNQNLQGIVEAFNQLANENIWVFNPAQDVVYQEFLHDMHQLAPAPAPAAPAPAPAAPAPAVAQPGNGGNFAQFAQEHPIMATAAGGALIVGGGLTLGPALLVGGLNLLGFGAAGPVAGSIAAGIQSIVYGGAVASGSAFALAQSAAMGGVVVGGAAELAVAAVAAGTGVAMVTGANNNTDGDGDGGNDGDGNGH